MAHVTEMARSGILRGDCSVAVTRTRGLICFVQDRSSQRTLLSFLQTDRCDRKVKTRLSRCRESSSILARNKVSGGLKGQACCQQSPLPDGTNVPNSGTPSCGPVWPALVLSGQLFVLSGQLLSCLASSCPVWPALVLSGQLWSCLASSGPVWPALVLSGQLLSRQASSCPVRLALVLSGPILSCQASPRNAIWRHSWPVSQWWYNPRVPPLLYRPILIPNNPACSQL